MNLVTKATLNSSKLEPFPFEKRIGDGKLFGRE